MCWQVPYRLGDGGGWGDTPVRQPSYVCWVGMSSCGTIGMRVQSKSSSSARSLGAQRRVLQPHSHSLSHSLSHPTVSTTRHVLSPLPVFSPTANLALRRLAVPVAVPLPFRGCPHAHAQPQHHTLTHLLPVHRDGRDAPQLPRPVQHR